MTDTDKAGLLRRILPDLPFEVIPFSAIADKLNDYKCREQLPDGAQSVIMILFPYYLGEEYYKNRNISMYAVPENYHSVISEMLGDACLELKKSFPCEEFVPFVDHSPLPEKYAAALAGLGVIGKNRLLINRDYGSYCFIGDIVTTAAFETRISPVGSCEGCGRCVKTCPSGALDNDSFNRDICVSSITQKKGSLSEEEKILVKKVGSVWCCDLCQSCCVMNKNIKLSPIKRFNETAKPRYDKGCDISDRAYSWRGEAVLLRNFDIVE